MSTETTLQSIGLRLGIAAWITGSSLGLPVFIVGAPLLGWPWWSPAAAVAVWGFGMVACCNIVERRTEGMTP